MQDFPSLYGITDDTLMPGHTLFEKVEQALRHGCHLIQYRSKTKDNNTVSSVKNLCSLVQSYHAKLIINDDIELAKAVQADGVHLGQNDKPIDQARDFLGKHYMIGATCHNSLSLAETAAKQSADYLAFGRFFASKTKSHAAPAELELLSQAKTRFSLPIVAIGGINTENAKSVLSAGADCLAICHSLFHGDVSRQTHYFSNLARYSK